MKNSDDWSIEFSFPEPASDFDTEDFIIKLETKGLEAFNVAVHRTPEELSERRFVSAYISARLTRL